MTRHIVCMGVSGSGKTTVAAMLAERLGYLFGEADEFHPQANVDKMASGTPLTDEDRWPWLADLARWMREASDAGRSTVLACSALKRSYRDVLNTGLAGGCIFVHLHGDAALIGRRMARRSHFMPPSLLRSQFDTLEALAPQENGIVLNLDETPEGLITQVLDFLTDLPGAPGDHSIGR